MKVWPFWKYLYFNRIQRWSLIALLLLMFVMIIAELAFSTLEKKNSSKITDKSLQRDYALLHRQLDSMHNAETAFFEQKSVSKAQFKPQNTPSKAPKQPISIDINKASAADWKAVPGIGNVLSERIVKYREKLGGFVIVSQIKEVYGISDSVFQVIQPHLKKKNYSPKKMNINISSLEELSAHPYLRNKWGKQIVNYRTKVKPFEQLEDIRELYGMNDSIYNKLAPYFTVK